MIPLDQRYCTDCRQIVNGPFTNTPEKFHQVAMRNRAPSGADSTYMCGPTLPIVLYTTQQEQ